MGETRISDGDDGREQDERDDGGLKLGAPSAIITPMANANTEIDRLSPEDLQEAGAVLDAAFGRMGMIAGLGLVFHLQPESWFCTRRSGRLVAVVGAHDYGPKASIGMMAVHPSAQGQGIGHALLAELVAHLEGRGCPVLLLDASAAGQHLYPKLGFVAEGETLRMARPAGAAKVTPLTPSDADGVIVRRLDLANDLEQMIAFDAAIFGASRATVLRSYCAASAPNVFLASDGQRRVAGYLLMRGGHIGPWVAASSTVARALLGAALQLPSDGPALLTCPASSEDAIALLGANGFVVTERLLHMRRGSSADPRQVEYIYAQASLTLG